jgi:hypothetical protein
MCYHGRSTFPLICARPLMWFGLSFSRWRTQHTKIKGWVEPFYSVRESEDQRRERTGARTEQPRSFGEFFGRRLRFPGPSWDVATANPLGINRASLSFYAVGEGINVHFFTRSDFQFLDFGQDSACGRLRRKTRSARPHTVTAELRNRHPRVDRPESGKV